MRRRQRQTEEKGSKNGGSDIGEKRQQGRRGSKTEFLDSMEWKPDIQISAATSVLVFFIYFTSLHPSVPGGDSGELIVSAYELGVAHPPGYPLFTILAKLALMFIPFGTPAWRVNVMSAVFSSLASGLLQLSVLRLTRSTGSSLLAVGLFSINKLTWTWSVSAEVFSLNNFFVALLLLLAVDFDATIDQSSLKKKFKFCAFIAGLSLTNQHTIVVYVFCLALWSVCKLYHYQIMSLKLLISGGLWFMLGLTPYLYLPLSAYLNVARWTWGDQRSISGFIKHIIRAEYGTFDLGKDQKGLGFTYTMNVYIRHIQICMSDITLWFALVGIVTAISWCFQKKHICCTVFSIMTALYLCLFCWRANLDLKNPLFRGVVERFWLQADMCVAVLASIGCFTAIRLVTEKFLGLAKVSLSSVFVTMVSGILIALQLKNISICCNSSNFIVRDFAQNILDKLPPNAVVLSKGDLPTNSLSLFSRICVIILLSFTIIENWRKIATTQFVSPLFSIAGGYLHLCEGQRRDLQILDVEVLSYEWSLPMLKKFYPRIDFGGDVWRLTNDVLPDGRRAFNFKTFLDKNYKKYPIFVCIGMQERDPSWTGHYQLWPYGVCSKVELATSRVEPSSWGNLTGGFSDKWNHEYDAFDATSWEKVVNDEMWHAKISTAYYLYKLAEESNDMRYKGELLVQSYELYFRAIKMNQTPSRLTSHESFPSFWHKNFALVLERLLHADTPHPLDRLSPNDPDVTAIKEAVGILEHHLQTLGQFEKVDQILENAAKRTERLEAIGKEAASAAAKHTKAKP